VADANGNKGYVEISTAVVQKLGDDDEQQHINDVAARIAPDAPKHPVSGLPMPHIAIATDGGVSELVPNSEGGWSVKSWAASVAESSYRVIYHNDRLIASRGYDRFMYDLSQHVGLVGTDSGKIYAGSKPVSMISTRNVASGQLIMGSMTDGSAMSLLHDNPADTDSAMVVHLSENYSTPFLPGDVQSAIMCDGEEGVVVGEDVIPLTTSVTGWEIINDEGAAVSNPSLGAPTLVDGDTLEFVNSDSDHQALRYLIPNVKAGERFAFSFVLTTVSGSGVNEVRAAQGVNTAHASTILREYTHGDAVWDASFVAEEDGPLAFCLFLGPGITSRFKLHAPVHKVVTDRSGRDNHAKIHGTLNRTKPSGSDIAVWSGFSSVNNVELANSKDWFPHDEDWSLMFATDSSSDFVLSQHGVNGAWSSTDPGMNIYVSGSVGSKDIRARRHDGAGLHGDRYLQIDQWDESNSLKVMAFVKRGDELFCWLNGRKIGSRTGWSSDPGAAAADNLRILLSNGWMSAPVYSKTAPSDDQIRNIHRDMLNKLKKPSALTGTVKAVAHDPVRGDDWIACSDRKLHRLTPRGTTFEQTVDVPVGVGDIKSLAVNDGDITVGGSAGVWVNQPEKNLREPVVKSSKSVQPFELGEGDSAKTDFYLPTGWKPTRAYVNGAKKRKGAQDDWQPLFDGYRWFIRFAVAPGVFDIDCDAVEV
ncbi:MAG: hypothetical protein OIF55_01165, partial [Amphritea sp.]|nr:hypothetical protein [Amphritea sp.]